jgi:hypothetical protein
MICGFEWVAFVIGMGFMLLLVLIYGLVTDAAQWEEE